MREFRLQRFSIRCSSLIRPNCIVSNPTAWSTIQSRAQECLDDEDDDDPPQVINPSTTKSDDEDVPEASNDIYGAIDDTSAVLAETEDAAVEEEEDPEAKVQKKLEAQVERKRRASASDKYICHLFQDEIQAAQSFLGPVVNTWITNKVHGPFGPGGRYGKHGSYASFGWYGTTTTAGVKCKNSGDRKKRISAPQYQHRLQTNRTFGQACRKLQTRRSKSVTVNTLLALPSEIVLYIISFLDPQDFLTMVHTSHDMKNFMATHAAAICNTTILARYPKQAKLLQAKYKDGWLVPTNPTFLRHQRMKMAHEVAYSMTEYYGVIGYLPWILHPRCELVQGNLTLPGPLLLCFLEKHPDLTHFLTTEKDDGYNPEDREDDKRFENFVQSLEVWTDYSFQYDDARMETREKALAKYDQYEDYYVEEHKKMWLDKPDVKRPRELMWYFGISGTKYGRDVERPEDLRVETQIEVLRRGIECLTLSG